MAHFFDVVWCGSSTIWGSDSKIGSFEIGAVSWDLYQRRPGLTRRLLPWPHYVDWLDTPANRRQAAIAHGLPPDADKQTVLARYDGTVVQEPPEDAVAEEDEEDEPAPEHAVEEEPVGAIEQRADAYTQKELRDQCAAHDLPIYGTKYELAERLIDNEV